VDRPLDGRYWFAPFPWRHVADIHYPWGRGSRIFSHPSGRRTAARFRWRDLVVRHVVFVAMTQVAFDWTINFGKRPEPR